MTKHRRWPWSRALPEPPSQAEIDAAQKRLQKAEAALATDTGLQALAQQQEAKARRYLHGLGLIMIDNHIGPSVESNFRGRKR